MIEIYKVMDKDQMDLVHAIRHDVFVVEQGIAEEMEIDNLDDEAIHVLAYDGGVPAGCGRMLVNGEVAKIGRVAVKKSIRRSGIGTGLCKLLITLARDIGVTNVYVESQLSAVGFYKSLGFSEEGGVFMEAGINHVKMTKSI